jgi:xanthine dehydrogenase accessory factor
VHDWMATLSDLWRRRQLAVLVTMASVKGSAPRAPGTKMLVTADGVDGTIGGGHLEFTAIDIARKQLHGGESAQLRRFPLGASLGQCCGGVVNLLFEPVAADAAWVGTLLALRAQGGEFVVVTPAHGAAHGGKLFVTRHETQGTLGTAPRDTAAAAIARDLIAGNPRARLVSVPDAAGAGDTMDALCFFDPVFPADFNVVLFGAGHVGRALVNILGGLPCRVTWIDSRDEEFPPAVPGNVEVVATDAPEAEADAATPGSYFLVMTHSHALDEQLSERILRRADFAYFGLIGSVAKRRQFERRLAARGIGAESLAAMICPIGVGGIAGKEPGVIAVAVAAELLQRRAAVRADALVLQRGGATNTEAGSVIVATGG